MTLITGKGNQLWHRSSIDRMYEWLRNETSGAHRKHVLPGYAHQDLLWGRAARSDVYPRIAEGLRNVRRPAQVSEHTLKTERPRLWELEEDHPRLVGSSRG